MSSPLLSVIIPTYHRNDLLAKCLDYLAPGVQTLLAEQYEIVVTDDGFQTTSEEMICKHYSWVKWVSGPRRGPAANRNNGVKYARGKWLAFTDDDCLPSPSWLSAFASAIAPDLQVYEGKTTCQAGICSPLEHAPINLTGGYLWSCNMMIEANFFQELGGFDEDFLYPHMEDVDLRERIKLIGCLISFVENAVVDHPPRRLPWGNRLGALHEYEVLYWHQKRGQPLSRINLLLTIIKTRIRTILAHSLSWHSWQALTSLTVEILYTFIRINSWYKKYPIRVSEVQKQGIRI